MAAGPALSRPTLALAIALLLQPVAAAAAAGDREVFADYELGLEGRSFFEDALDPRQSAGDASLRFEPELSVRWPSADAGFVFRPFLRLDSNDDERTHFDVRELYVYRRFGDWTARAGVRRVFWGATESVHLVDVLNQTDLVENPDTEDKLGQPLLEVSRTKRWGTLSLFVLPRFRERTFPGPEGRLRPPLPVLDEPVYESSSARDHVDWALRYEARLGGLDLGVSHFSGTARAPRLVPSAGGDRLQPIYDLADQTGLDATAASGNWLWKLEGIRYRSRAERYLAAAAGFERTTSGLWGGRDLGLLLELLWDERGAAGPSPYEEDVFVGVRLGLNDIATTEILAGVILDLDRGRIVNVEASRRLSELWSFAAELRLFNDTRPGDTLDLWRREDHLLVELRARW